MKNNNRMFLSCWCFSAVFFTVNVFPATKNLYSDDTRELFYLPRSSATGGSDIVFEKSGSPQANTAVLGLDSANDLTLSYSSYYQNTFSASVLSYAGAIDRVSGFCLSLSYLYNPGIPGTDNLEIGNDGQPVYDPTRLQYSSESVILFHAGYGYKFTITPRINLGVGLGLNAQRHRLPFDLYRGYGMGFDAGAAIDFPRPGIRLALDCDNVTSNYTRWSSTYSELAYPHLRFGMGWQTDIPYIYGHLAIQYKTPDLLSNEGANAEDLSSLFGANDTVSSTDQNLNIPSDTPGVASLRSDPVTFFMSGSIGFEYRIMDIFAVRVGHSVMNAWTFGCGLSLFKKKLGLDFACLTHELAPTYQLSVTYRH
ncbi:MAG TPA: hypothetical protein VLX68_01700 [Chitinivibrionales bacterium]|nr:hypothetical protein [Chitinivibrionales bacterium]